MASNQTHRRSIHLVHSVTVLTPSLQSQIMFPLGHVQYDMKSMCHKTLLAPFFFFWLNAGHSHI